MKKMYRYIIYLQAIIDDLTQNINIVEKNYLEMKNKFEKDFKDMKNHYEIEYNDMKTRYDVFKTQQNLTLKNIGKN